MTIDNILAYPARQELTALNKQLAEATAARDAAQAAYDRLERPNQLLTEVLRDYAVEKALFDAAIVVWYETGCFGARPELPSRMVELERQLGDLRRDLGLSACVRTTSDCTARPLDVQRRPDGCAGRKRRQAAGTRACQTRQCPGPPWDDPTRLAISAVSTEQRNGRGCRGDA